MFARDSAAEAQQAQCPVSAGVDTQCGAKAAPPRAHDNNWRSSKRYFIDKMHKEPSRPAETSMLPHSGGPGAPSKSRPHIRPHGRFLADPQRFLEQIQYSSYQHTAYCAMDLEPARVGTSPKRTTWLDVDGLDSGTGQISQTAW